ncbi:MAG: hypothetical protein IJ740_06330 [Ruminococcus sp.]|nr:hypothetical protein [Ruminococcus sp.]
MINILKNKAIKNGLLFALILHAVMFITPLLVGFIAYKATGSHSAPSAVQLFVYLACAVGCVPLKKFFNSKSDDDRLFICTYAVIYLALAILEAVIMLMLMVNKNSFLIEMTFDEGSLFGGISSAAFAIIYSFEVCTLPFILGVHDLAKQRESIGNEFAVVTFIAQCAANIIFVNMILFSRTW